MARAGKELEKLNPPRYPSDFYQRRPRYLTHQEIIASTQRHIKDLTYFWSLEINPETDQFLHGSAVLEWTDLAPYKLPDFPPQPGRPYGKQKIRVEVQSGLESENPLVLIEDDRKKNPVENALDRHFRNIERLERAKHYSSGAWRKYGPY